MPASLPLLAAALLYLAHRTRSQTPRDAIVNSAILWSLLLVACFETLSPFHALTRPALATFWTLVSACAALAIRRPRTTSPLSPTAHLSRPDRLLLTSLGLLAATLLLAAIVAPPNTWDAMSYHMPRVLFWTQNRSIEHFPTHVSRQVESPPFAEFVIAQSQILLGSDRLANLGQWAALFGSAVAASSIAQRLGATPRGQLLAALTCFTIPPALLEATGAKNDDVAAFWTLCATLQLLDLSTRPTHTRTLRTGAAIGLAMLTKGTFYFFAWPVVALLAADTIRRHRWRAAAPLAAAAALAIALNAPHFSRNQRTLHDLFGSPVTHATIENTHYTPQALASNVLRNLAAQSATPSAWVNQHLLYDPVVRLHHLAGLDPDADSYGTFRVIWGNCHDDNTGCGLHVPLILASLAAILTARRRQPLAAALALALVFSFLTFCLLTKWQPWHGRYLIVLCALFAPLLGLSLERAPAALAYSVTTLLLLAALTYALLNQTRPVLAARNIFNTPRLEQYFAARQQSLLDPFHKAAELVAASGATEVGLLSEYDALLYPLHVAIDQARGLPVRLDYLNGFQRTPPERTKVRVPHLERRAQDVLLVLPWFNWGAFQPTPKVLVEDTGARFYVAADFGDVAVYSRAAAADIADRIFLERGWFPIQRHDQGWSAWALDTGKLTLCRPTAATVLLNGTLATAAAPNTFTFRLNGRDIAAITFDSLRPRPFGPLTLPLDAGDNLLEILSQQPPAAAPTPRTMLLGNLTITNHPDTLPVTLQPIPLPNRL